MAIGELIKAARENAGLTQAELGEKIGVSGVAIMRYEKGQRQPRLEQLKAIAAALGVPLETLIGVPDSVRAVGVDQAVVMPRDLLPSEFNEFERFIETLGYYTRLDGDNYRLHKGKASVVITPDELKALVRASKATVAALVQDLMETATPPPDASETAPDGK